MLEKKLNEMLGELRNNHVRLTVVAINHEKRIADHEKRITELERRVAELELLLSEPHTENGDVIYAYI